MMQDICMSNDIIKEKQKKLFNKIIAMEKKYKVKEPNRFYDRLYIISKSMSLREFMYVVDYLGKEFEKNENSEYFSDKEKKNIIKIINKLQSELQKMDSTLLEEYERIILSRKWELLFYDGVKVYE